LVNVASKIEAILAEEEGIHNDGVVAFETQVQVLRKKKAKLKPQGKAAPKAIVSSVTTYVRDPEVKAWVLENAKGTCECCETPAPFSGTDGEPFLEVHHVRRLADKGADQITNAVALCPDCHRALHYAIDRQDRVEVLYKMMGRLVR
jgi:5-methylcytosine-specific restriction protein A